MCEPFPNSIARSDAVMPGNAFPRRSPSAMLAPTHKER